jgi:hypothetical protein
MEEWGALAVPLRPVGPNGGHTVPPSGVDASAERRVSRRLRGDSDAAAERCTAGHLRWLRCSGAPTGGRAGRQL